MDHTYPTLFLSPSICAVRSYEILILTERDARVSYRKSRLIDPRIRTCMSHASNPRCGISSGKRIFKAQTLLSLRVLSARRNFVARNRNVRDVRVV